MKILDNERIKALTGDLASRDILILQHARDSLVALGESAVPELLQAAHDPSDQVRWEAMRVLGEIGDLNAAPALVSALTDENFVVRWIASEALASLGRRALIPLLNELVERPDDVWLRRGAHRVFGTVSRGDLAKLLNPIIKALEDIEPALQVPIAAINTLHGLETELETLKEE